MTPAQLVAAVQIEHNCLSVKELKFNGITIAYIHIMTLEIKWCHENKIALPELVIAVAERMIEVYKQNGFTVE